MKISSEFSCVIVKNAVIAFISTRISDMKHIRYIFLGLLLSSVLHSAEAQSFKKWFNEGAMRVDLVFSGTADKTSYSFTGIKKEPFYSGSKTILTDPFDYGDHKCQVKDAESGILIFSYTYSTLFREWQTTTEAETVNRAFSHVVRFPWPRAKVIVEIYDRNDQGDFIRNWSEVLDPESIFADSGNQLAFETFDIEINGPPNEKVDILFVAEGYTAEEMDKFIDDAKRSAGYIFSEEPFKGNKISFNIRAVKSISKDSGTDIPGEGIWKNTVMNSNFYTFGIERYMTTLDYKSVCDVASNAHYDQVYILVNTSKYGGGGIYNMYAISAVDNEISRAVVVHEFGHAFGGLADEYYNSSVAYNSFFNLKAEPWNPNLTTLVDFNSKWKDLISEVTPVPTPPGDEFLETVGVYEGGGYVSKGVYRPMIDCMMHSNEAEFCPVCSWALLQMINRFKGL